MVQMLITQEILVLHAEFLRKQYDWAHIIIQNEGNVGLETCFWNFFSIDLFSFFSQDNASPRMKDDFSPLDIGNTRNDTSGLAVISKVGLQKLDDKKV